MKRRITLLLLLSFTIVAQAQLLWKISGNGLSEPSYVIGTHHLAPLSVLDSISGLDDALANTRQVYGELVMADLMTPENLQMIQKEMLLPRDTTLKTLFSPAQYDSVAAVVKQLMGMDLALFDQMKPAAINTQLVLILTAQSIKGFNPQQQLDTWFQVEAGKHGKPVFGFEQIEKQVAILYSSQTLQRQCQLLYCLITDLDKAKQDCIKLNAAYMQQDIDLLLALTEEKMNNACDSRPEELDILIYQRNAAWAKAMPAIMKAQPTFFVVGAAHLAGERGVLQLLKNTGYVVAPMQ